MTIKVANIIEEGRLGGPQIRIAEVAGRMNRDQNDKKIKINNIIIFPFEDGELMKRRLEEKKARYLQMPLHRLSKEKIQLLKYIIFFFYEVWSLFKIFKKYKIDVVHVSGGSWQYKGVIAGKIAGCRVLWHLNDTKMPMIIQICFKFFADKFAHGFIVAAERVRKYYVEDLKIGLGKPIFEVQAPVDCSFFNSEKVIPDSKILSTGGVNIVSVGNINPYKGFEYFLGMAKELNKENLNLKFWIIGPSFESQKQYFKKLNELRKKYRLDNCFFYGACNDVRKILKVADIYVCSSIAEASPLSVWEAMSMKKAIVSTDVGDVSRFIRNGENGFIVPAGNSIALAQKVKELINNKEMRKEFGLSARQAVFEKLDIKHCVRAHEEAYIGIME